MLIPLVRGAPLVNFQFTSNMKESLDIEWETIEALIWGKGVLLFRLVLHLLLLEVSVGLWWLLAG